MAEPAEDPAAKVAAVFGNVIEAMPLYEPVEIDPDSDADVVDLLTRVCYFYPQYTLEMAEKLTNAQVMALLVQAEKQKAIEYYNHVLIAVAPHTKDGGLVETLIEKYKDIAES